MFDLIDDTIVAVASPSGYAPRGIVRCSGSEAIAVAARIFASQSTGDVSALPGWRRVCGLVSIEPDCAVPAELYLFRAPASYTRQDCVEFHVPGSPALLTMLVERIVQLGARPAQPGEFTARAFLNGAMDLTRAESVAAVIRARSDSQLRAARRMMEGGLADEAERILGQIAELVALVEADIDFAEEPIEFITPAQLVERLAGVTRDLERFLAGTESAERIDALPRILLVGRSNAGKSTLLNRLSGLDRAICSALPGTTRDLLSAPVTLGRCEAVLLDAAGVDPVMESLSELAGAATVAAAAQVDALCLVIDLCAARDDGVFALAERGTPCVVVGNKIDGLTEADVASGIAWLESAGLGSVCALSAATGEGVDRCRGVLAEALHLPDNAPASDVTVVTARQHEALENARDALLRAASEAAEIGETIDRADVIAFELREALEALGSIAGSVTTEDLLGRVFASFCIGK